MLISSLATSGPGLVRRRPFFRVARRDIGRIDLQTCYKSQWLPASIHGKPPGLTYLRRGCDRILSCLFGGFPQ
jgi:hypothetical protein